MGVCSIFDFLTTRPPFVRLGFTASSEHEADRMGRKLVGWVCIARLMIKQKKEKSGHYHNGRTHYQVLS